MIKCSINKKVTCGEVEIRDNCCDNSSFSTIPRMECKTENLLSGMYVSIQIKFPHCQNNCYSHIADKCI